MRGPGHAALALAADREAIYERHKSDRRNPPTLRWQRAPCRAAAAEGAAVQHQRSDGPRRGHSNVEGETTLVAGATATTQEDLWSPSAEDVAGQLDAAIASSPSAASSPVHTAVGRGNADQRGGQAAGGALTSPLTSPAGSVGGASPPASVSLQRKSLSNRKKLTQAQMVEALQRRGDWATKSCQCCTGSKSCRGGPSDELLNRLQSNLPQEIAHRHASNTSDGRPGPVPQNLKTLEFGLLVMLDQETRRISAQDPDRAVEFTMNELVDLAEKAFNAGLTRVSPHASNGVGHAIYDGVHSIKAMAKFGENRSSDFDTPTLLEIHHRRAPSTYRLSQDGKRLAAACHLLAHDATRVGPAVVCTCGRPPPPDPNADFANYFVDDEEGRQFNPDGKRIDAATAAVAAAVDDDGVATVTTLAAASATQCAATAIDASATQCNATKKHQRRQRCKWGHDCRASGWRNIRARTDHFCRFTHPEDSDWVDDRPQKKKLRRETQGTRRSMAQSARRTSVSIDLT
jgi:hypothetical protein